MNLIKYLNFKTRPGWFVCCKRLLFIFNNINFRGGNCLLKSKARGIKWAEFELNWIMQQHNISFQLQLFAARPALFVAFTTWKIVKIFRVSRVALIYCIFARFRRHTRERNGRANDLNCCECVRSSTFYANHSRVVIPQKLIEFVISPQTDD